MRSSLASVQKHLKKIGHTLILLTSWHFPQSFDITDYLCFLVRFCIFLLCSFLPNHFPSWSLNVVKMAFCTIPCGCGGLDRCRTCRTWRTCRNRRGLDRCRSWLPTFCFLWRATGPHTHPYYQLNTSEDERKMKTVHRYTIPEIRSTPVWTIP